MPQPPSPLIVAVDGPSASGKGTIAKKLAAQFGFAYLDTGALYRAVGLAVLRAGLSPADAEASVSIARNLPAEELFRLTADPDLRTEACSAAASQVAALPEVRASLLRFQRDFCTNPPGGLKGAVLDGRDIGTVIAPQAQAKLFVTASPEKRAERRFKELRARGENVTEARVLEDMRARDRRDAERDAAPAKPAADAVLLDTSALTADAAFEAARALVEAKIGKIS
jgi:cytidylate kinase